MSSVPPLPSAERWSVAHAAAMLGATAAAMLSGNPLSLAAVALPSFLALIFLGRGHYTDGGSFGSANLVTGVRLAIVLALLAFTDTPGAETALWVVCVFTLDGIDGWLARRGGRASSFGARFDMECDALLILGAGLLLALDGRLGPWILTPGAMRYLYVLALAIWPTRGEVPPSRLGRYGFSLMVVSLAWSLWPLPLHAPLAIGASGALCLSFAHSFYWSLRRAPG